VRDRDEGQFQLLRKRRFGPFFLTQSLGAFNDNVFKNALVILLAFGVAGLSDDGVNRYVNLAAGLFILPFFLFSATAGQIAEKYEKARLIRGIKLLEIAIMSLAVIGFLVGNVALLLVVLFLMGTQSALFGPVKYSILPQHLHEDELVGGNALVESATFLAILLGTVAGGVFMAVRGDVQWVSATVIVIAILGYLASRGIPAAPPTAPTLRINWNPVTETWRNFRFMRTNRTVMLAVLGISWFWLYGAVFLSQLPNYTKIHLGGDETVVTLLLTVFSLGIGVGSLLCERLSGHKIEIGLVPLGSIGLTVFGIDLFFAQQGMAASATLAAMPAGAFLAAPGSFRVLCDLLLIGVFGGFYIVPLYALIQTRAEPSHRSRVIAGNNILNALFMVIAALMAIVLLEAGLTIPQLLLIVAIMNAAVAMFIYSVVPEFLMRFLAWVVVNTLYRIEKSGLEHVPEEGPAIIVCNHVSFVDALVLGGNIRRPVRFVMYYKIFRIPFLNFIFRTARAIPIAGAREDPELMEKAFAEIRRALENGDLVGIFPEGSLTPDGEIQAFRRGITRILESTPVPVVPVALRGLWDSIFSRRHARLRHARLPRRIWSRIGLAAGPVVPPELATAELLEARVRELRGENA
jgi:1-acyl-sn-glycerol-3-phosphate acyltransferase